MSSLTRRKRRSPDQIILALREADGMLSGGQTIAAVCQKLSVCEQTYHRWRAQYGGMQADDVKRLKELEAENARLKRIVADQALNIAALNEVSKGNW